MKAEDYRLLRFESELAARWSFRAVGEIGRECCSIGDTKRQKDGKILYAESAVLLVAGGQLNRWCARWESSSVAMRDGVP